MMAASLEIFQFVGWIRKSAQNILMMLWWRLSCMKHNGNILNSRRMCRFHLRTVQMVPPTRTFLHQQSASFPAHQLPEPGLTATATGFGGAKTLSTSKSIEILPE